ncbi:hypothetical protein DAERI_050026 [Deinococcus aerius]|uniref:Uncharacterized protein n=2 Tax=Deinococcus aerius TaxID=200253 RepID=A0A2I9DSN5_9DEIO|nr:hypothetical protein DAERI_050026 [Deinococcus aerius]
MEELGLDRLDDLPLLMQGLASVLSSPQVAPHAKLVREARHVLHGLRTRAALLHEVREFNAYAVDPMRRKEPAYEIEESEDGVFFRRVTRTVGGVDFAPNGDVARAREALHAGFDHHENQTPLANMRREFRVEVTARRSDSLAGTATISAPVNLASARLPALPRHDIARRPQGEIRVPWVDLEVLAAELDALDTSLGVRPENWVGRLANARLRAARDNHLEPEGELVLAGLRHLVGLPGAGKTTLITLLCVWLSRHDVKTAVFFTSVEVSRTYLEKLDRYGASVGMLVGQGGRTRARHAARLSELIASGDPQGGFGRDVFGASLFGANCLLPAFSAGGSDAWPLGEAPCEQVYQRAPQEPGEPGSKAQEVRCLCPAWSACGRNKAARYLTRATVWLGHVASLDTALPTHASKTRLRYFELVSRTFDVVIVDECDAAQQSLDDHGAVTLKLTGSEDSLHFSGVQGLQIKLAREDNFMLADPRVEAYDEYFDQFSWHTKRLVTTIQRLDQETRDRYAGQLLTSNRILKGLMQDAPQERQTAVWDFWQTALYDAFGAVTPSREWRNARRYAKDLGLGVIEAREAWQRLNKMLREYLRADTLSRRETARTAVERVTVRVAGLDSRPAHDDLRLLLTVSCMIVAFQRVAVHAQRLVLDGLVDEQVLSRSDSAELQKHVPVNVMGLLSGVRFRMEPNGTTSIDYLLMNSTPRLLLYHLHELNGPEVPGPAVLLTSATSFLEPSTTYHVNVTPRYVLSPETPDVRADLTRYAFAPVRDPRTGLPLAFSGAGRSAREHLRRMVDGLVGGPWEESEVGKALAALEAEHDVRRKAAFVVNSYEQVELIVEHLRARHPEAHRRVRGVIRTPRAGPYVTSAQVEALGDDEDVELLVFPMLALGRGVNVVFSSGPHARKAAIGCLYFLTRPHPASDDLSFLLSVVARATQEADAAPPPASLEAAQEAWMDARRRTFARSVELIGSPLQASLLGEDLFEAFSANLAVPVLQTIGRGMRGGSPVWVFFVDAAWARKSAQEQPETPTSSVLVGMRDVLRKVVHDPDPLRASVYRELYAAFLQPLEHTEGVRFPDPATPRVRRSNRKPPPVAVPELDVDMFVPPADLDLEEI